MMLLLNFFTEYGNRQEECIMAKMESMGTRQGTCGRTCIIIKVTLCVGDSKGVEGDHRAPSRCRNHLQLDRVVQYFRLSTGPATNIEEMILYFVRSIVKYVYCLVHYHGTRFPVAISRRGTQLSFGLRVDDMLWIREITN